MSDSLDKLSESRNEEAPFDVNTLLTQLTEITDAAQRALETMDVQNAQVNEAMRLLDAGRVRTVDGVEVPTTLVERAATVATALEIESDLVTEQSDELEKLRQALRDLINVGDPGAAGCKAAWEEVVCDCEICTARRLLGE